MAFQEETAPQDQPAGESVSGRRAPTSEIPQGPPEAANLVTFYGAEEQKKIATTCLADYEADVSSRSGRMRKLRDFAECYAMVTKPKSFPHQRAANIATPVLSGPQLQIQSRIFDMVIPASGKIVTYVPATIADMSWANIAEKYVNAYIRYKMPEMAQGMDDTVHQVCLFGSGFRRTYWNGHEKRVCSDWIPIEDFVVAHSQRSQDPSMRDVARYTMVQHLTIYDLEAYQDSGVYTNVDQVKAKQVEAQEGRSRSELGNAVDKIDGVTKTDESTVAGNEDKPRQVLEMHRMWRLPNNPTEHPSFDGKAHPVIIVIDEASEQVLRIALREEDDPDDLKRFQREMQQHQQALMQHQAVVQQFTMVVMAAQQMGKEVPEDVGGMLPPAPTEPAKPRKREICFFTHYKAFPSEGFYGLGYGDLLYGLAKASNTMLNQHIDGVTLRNARPGFISKNLRGQRGAINVEPGKLVEVDAPMSSIRDGIMFLDPPLNDPTTMPLVKLFDSMADKLAGNSDLMSGQVPGSNQTAKGMEILQGEMMAPITVFARRILLAFTHELEKIHRCLGVFTSDEEIVDIVNEQGAPEQMKIGRAMFTPTAKVVPASDPRTKSQRMQEAHQLFGAVINNPYIMQSPAAPAVLHAVTSDQWRALGAERLLPLLPPPPGPPEPPKPKPQYEENAGFLNGQDSPVHPDDNDMEHVAGLQQFMGSMEATVLDPKGKEMAQKHLRAHVAQMIMKQGAQQNGGPGAAGGMGGPFGGGGSPMAGGGGGPAIPPMAGGGGPPPGAGGVPFGG